MMGGNSTEFSTGFESYHGNLSYWSRVIPALGILLLIAASIKSITILTGGGTLAEAMIDLLLISLPGTVMLYIGIRLPKSSIQPAFYPRIVMWVFGGVVVMGIVLGLRVLHPGVAVQFTSGTQAVLLAIGSIAGLGIGINEAQAFTHAKTLEKQNETLKQTEQRLEEAVTQLEESNEQLERFAYAASHDLQEPLRMVTSYLQLLENRYGDELDEDGEEFIEFAVDGADRMRERIDGILEYSRVETQDDPFDAVDLDVVLDNVLTDLQLKIEENGAEITREPLPTVEGNGRQLRRLFQNLLSNAIEYSGDDPPRIHVSVEHGESEKRISVHDEGIGIDSDDPNCVFDIFQRLHSSDEHAGSGIGLALCKRIVERHGGEIWVESEPGDGSTFIFTMPSTGEMPTPSDGSSQS